MAFFHQSNLSLTLDKEAVDRVNVGSIILSYSCLNCVRKRLSMTWVRLERRGRWNSDRERKKERQRETETETEREGEGEGDLSIK